MNNSKLYIFIGLTLCLAPYLFLCMYIFPSGDDYSYAWKGAKSSSFLNILLGEWRFWSGRYISNILVLRNPILYGNFGVYQLIPTFLITAFIGTKSLLIYTFISTSKAQALMMSMCFVLIYLNVIPHIAEGVYWYTAAVTYFAPIILFPIHLILLDKLSKSRQPLSIVCLILLQLLLTGFNEVLMIIMTVLHLSFALRSKSKHKVFWLLLLTQLIFSSIMYFAPGNEIRLSHFANKHNVLHTLLYGSAHTLRFTTLLLLTPSLWISMLLFVKMNFIKKKQTTSNWFWIALFFFPQFIACTGPFWNTGILGQHRSPNFALYFQVLIVFTFLLFESKHKFTSALKSVSSKISFQRLLTALAISFLIWGNGRTALKDLFSGEAWAFHQENLAREIKIKSYVGLQDTTLLLPKHLNKPKSIFVYDLTKDPKHWYNGVYMSYYGLKGDKVSIHCKP